MFDKIDDGGNGTSRHAGLPASDSITAGVPSKGAGPASCGGSVDGRLPPCNRTVATRSELPSANFAHRATTNDGSDRFARNPPSTSRQPCVNPRDAHVSRTPQPHGDKNASPPPASAVPGGAERASGRASDTNHYSDNPQIAAAGARAARAAGGAAGIAAGAGQRPVALTCGACGGTGRHAHFLGGCSFCKGSGLLLDERRLDLIDAIADKLSDTCDLDVGWHRYAEAVVGMLERMGLDVTTLREIG